MNKKTRIGIVVAVVILFGILLLRGGVGSPNVKVCQLNSETKFQGINKVTEFELRFQNTGSSTADEKATLQIYNFDDERVVDAKTVYLSIEPEESDIKTVTLDTDLPLGNEGLEITDCTSCETAGSVPNC